MKLNNLIRYTILGTIAGAILAFNMYHADYKLLIAQIGTIILLALYIIGNRRIIKDMVQNYAQITMLVFLGVCILSFILSPHKLASGQELYKVGTWIIFGIAVAAASYAAPLEQIINVWLACAGIIAVYGILQFFGIDFIKFKLPGERIVSTFGNATLLAGFLAMTIPLALTRVVVVAPPCGADLSMEKRGKAVSCQLSAVSILIVLTACLLLSKSRGGILAAIFGCGIVISELYEKKLGVMRKRALEIALVAAILLAIPKIRLLFFELIFFVIFRDTSRLYIWNDAMQMVFVNPLFGTGIGTFRLYFPNFVSGGVLELHPIQYAFINHAHCEYLEILIEMGIIGLAAFLAVVVAIIRNAGITKNYKGEMQNYTQRIGLFAGFMAVLVHNALGVDLRYTSTGIFFWMTAGILAKQSPAVAAASYAATSVKLAAQGAAATRKAAQGAATTALIIIAAVTAIYFTLKPYINIQQVKGQQFFAKEISQLDEKIGILESEKKDKKNSADYLFNLGTLYAKRKDFDKAKRCFIKTIVKNPKHAGAFNNLGNIAFFQNDEIRGKILFYKAVRAEPGNVNYIMNLAYADFKANNLSSAMDSVEKALRIDPENSRALLLQRQITE